MTIDRSAGAAGVLLALLFFGSAYAQDSSDDQVAVWSVIERQWTAEQKGDDQWIDELLAADFVGWPDDSPAPRNKASTSLWRNFHAEQWKMLEHELYPLSIVVHDDVAIAHYLYSAASEGPNGRTVNRSGRYTDVLVRVGDAWKFLSWHGGDRRPATGSD